MWINIGSDSTIESDFLNKFCHKINFLSYTIMW